MESLFKSRQRRIQDRPACRPAGVVHQDMDGLFGEQGGDLAVQVAALGEIGGEEIVVLAGASLHLPDDGGHQFGGAGDKRHVGAQRRQFQCNGLADAFAAAPYKGVFAVEI